MAIGYVIDVPSGGTRDQYEALFEKVVCGRAGSARPGTGPPRATAATTAAKASASSSRAGRTPTHPYSTF